MDDLLNIGLSNALAAALLALIAFAVGSFCRRPALVHGLWLLVLLKLVTPPLLRIPIAWPAPAEADILEVNKDLLPLETISLPPPQPIGPPAQESAITRAVPIAAEEELSAPATVAPTPPGIPLWPRVAPLVWLGGSLAWFALACVRLVRFRRLLRYVRPAPAALQERARRLARRLDMRRCPVVGLLPGRLAPMLWAVGGSPRLLLPANLLDRLDGDHLDTLLVHELAHLRRRDHWVRALEFAVMGLYWWHPVVWYARRELREAEEQCCDAWVVSTLPGAGRTYASALMDTLDFLSTAPAAVPPLASGLGQVSDLKRRLTMILRGTTPRALSWPGCFAVLALAVCFLPLLPALRGEPPVKKGPRRIIVEQEQAQEELKRAEAELELAETVLQAKRADLQRAQLDAQAAEIVREKQAAIKALNAAIAAQLKKKAEGEKKAAYRQATYRIEITLPIDKDVNCNEVVEKIKSVLPEKLRGKIVCRHVPLAPPDVLYRAVAPPVPGGVAAPFGSPEARINELEKKLEKVLHELHELRKQMKGPRPANPTTPPPGVGTDPFNPVPPPATPPLPEVAPRRPRSYTAPTVPLRSSTLAPSSR